MEEVFKVVKKTSNGFRSWSFGYLGAVDYEVGKKTIPKDGFGPLCAFPSFFRANWFVSTFSYISPSSCAILRCKAEMPNKPPGRLSSLVRSCPETTIFCSSITPLEVVKDYSK